MIRNHKILCDFCTKKLENIKNKDEIVGYQSECETRKCLLNMKDDRKNKASLLHRLAQGFTKILLDKQDIETTRDHYLCPGKDTKIIEKTDKNEIVVFEFTYIVEDEFRDKRFADVAIIDKDTFEVRNIIEIVRSSKTEESSRIDFEDIWFEFKTVDVFEYYLQKRNVLKDKRLECCECKTRKEDKRIFIKQSCAGSGKTYSSVRLFLGEETPELRRFNKIVFISKMNSTISTITTEIEKMFRETEGISDISNDTIENRKFKYNFTYTPQVKESPASDTKESLVQSPRDTKETFMQSPRDTKETFMQSPASRDICFYLSTIDSLFSVISRTGAVAGSIDSFEQISNNIYYKNKYKLNNKIRIGDGAEIVIDSNTLLIVDESQDLEDFRAIAIFALALKFKCSFYLIGDKLQSILNAKNTFVMLMDIHRTSFSKLSKEKRLLKSLITIVKPTTCIRRFRNKKSLQFLNQNIDYEEFGLEFPDSIYPAKELCEEDVEEIMYKHNFMSSKEEEEKVIETIIESVDKTVRNDPDCIPSDFTFIFPYLKNNLISLQLEDRLNRYWKECNHPHINKYILDKNLAEEIMCFRHTSEGGSRVDLSQSKFISRIMTIHSSKGMTTRYAFLVDPSENTIREVLCRNEDTPNELRLNSFLNVAYTRHTHKLTIFRNQNKMSTKSRSRALENFLIMNKRKYRFKYNGEYYERSFRLFVLEFLCNDPTVCITNINTDLAKDEAVEKIDKPDSFIDCSFHEIRNLQALYTILYSVCRTSKEKLSATNTLRYVIKLVHAFISNTINKFSTDTNYERIDLSNKSKALSYKEFKKAYDQQLREGNFNMEHGEVNVGLIRHANRYSGNFLVNNIRNDKGIESINKALLTLKRRPPTDDKNKYTFAEYAIFSYLFRFLVFFDNRVMSASRLAFICQLGEMELTEPMKDFLMNTEQVISKAYYNLIKRYQKEYIKPPKKNEEPSIHKINVRDLKEYDKDNMQYYFGMSEKPEFFFEEYATEDGVCCRDPKNRIPVYYQPKIKMERGKTLLTSFAKYICIEDIREVNYLALDTIDPVFIKFNRHSVLFEKARLFAFITYFTDDSTVENAIIEYKKNIEKIADYKMDENLKPPSWLDDLSYHQFQKETNSTNKEEFREWVYVKVFTLLKTRIENVGYIEYNSLSLSRLHREHLLEFLSDFDNRVSDKLEYKSFETGEEQEPEPMFNREKKRDPMALYKFLDKLLQKKSSE